MKRVSESELEVPVKEKKLTTLEAVSFDPSTATDFEKAFQSIADTLMNSTILMIGGKEHRMAEIEFYLKDEAHFDSFTHADEQQLVSGQWYFHKMGKGFKGGSYKGLDVTFSKRGYSGILIRALLEISTQKYIDGPSLVVDHILSLTKAEDILALTKKENFSWSATETTSDLYLKEDSEGKLDHKTLFSSGRVGLVLRTDNHSLYCLKPYRFLTYPLLCKKAKQHLALELYDSGKTKLEIVRLTGCTDKSVSGYIEAFEQSKKAPKKASEYYATKLNAEDFSKFYYVLRQEAKKVAQQEAKKEEQIDAAISTIMKDETNNS